MKKALVTGITGQDGSHLAEILLGKGYEVHGMMRRSSSFNTGRIDHIFQDEQSENRTLFLHFGDLTDGSSLSSMIRKIQPNEIYNLGAQSHVKVSFDTAEYTTDVITLGNLRILECMRDIDFECKFYQASSSEIFGASVPPQSETTQFRPQSPYAVSKLSAYWNTVNYRTGHNLFASNGILFNHEGERRGETFVSRKITRGIANILLGNQKCLRLGNLDAKRDWGYAKEYMEAAWMILQHSSPDDFVIATGEMHTVKEFCQEAFSLVGLDWERFVVVDPFYFRPNEVDALCGDYSKAKNLLGWTPKTKFKDLVKLMLRYDLQSVGLDPNI